MAEIIRVKVDVKATLEVTGDECLMLEHLTDYSLIEWFVEKCNSTIPKEVLQKRLSSLHGKVRLICEAIKTCQDALDNERSGQ